MPINLGSTNIRIPYSKAYLGNKLVYQAEQLIPFTSCPFPTSWTQVTAGTKYKASNEYGEWKITANSCLSVGVLDAYNAFDNDGNTPWVSYSLTDYLIIECPVAIQPSAGFVWYMNIGNNGGLEGYNESTGSWEWLMTLPRQKDDRLWGSNLTSKTNFYTKFRIACPMYGTGRYTQIYEFQITSGTIKIE